MISECKIILFIVVLQYVVYITEVKYILNPNKKYVKIKYFRFCTAYPVIAEKKYGQ